MVCKFEIDGPYGSGVVTVVEKGLYYILSANVKTTDRRIYVLTAKKGSDLTVLGTLTPDEDTFALKRMIPKKNIDLNSVELYIKPKYETHRIIQVSEKDPFPEIKELRKASYIFESGIGKIKIPI